MMIRRSFISSVIALFAVPFARLKHKPPEQQWHKLGFKVSDDHPDVHFMAMDEEQLVIETRQWTDGTYKVVDQRKYHAEDLIC